MAARTRRTTITLPADLLKQIERSAREKHQTVSATIAQGMEDFFARRPWDVDPKEFIAKWRKSYSSLTDEEMLILDGVIPKDLRRAG